MSSVPSDLRYSKEHEWVAIIEPGKARIGISDYAQSALGDIVYIQLPKVGESVTSGKVCGEVESTKSVSEIYAPITGTVVAVNTNLDKNPELLNSDPYGQAWIAEISFTVDANDLLSADEYIALIQ